MKCAKSNSNESVLTPENFIQMKDMIDNQKNKISRLEEAINDLKERLKMSREHIAIVEASEVEYAYDLDKTTKELSGVLAFMGMVTKMKGNWNE